MPDTSLLKPYNATCGGGLVLNKDVYDMAPGEALQLVNFEPSTEGGYRRLNGTTKYNSTIVPQVSASTERVQMSAIFNDKIIAARGGTVVYGDTSGSWTSLATSKGTTHTYDFDKFNFNGTSKILIATGEAAAFTVDSSFNVDVINATGGGTAPTNPKFVKTFANHVFYGGMSNSTHSILFSVPFQEDNFTSASGAGEVKVGDIVTGLKVFRDELFIFCQRKIYKLTGTTSSNFALAEVAKNVGTIAHHSIQELGGDLIFLAADGLRTVAGTERIGDVELGTISKQVQERINEIEYDNVTATVVRNKSQYRLFYTNVSQSSAVSKGVIGTLTPNGFEWSETKGIQATGFASGLDKDGVEQLYHGDNSGYVYNHDTGNVFNPAGSASNVEAQYYTPDLDFGDIGTRKTIKYVKISVTPEGTAQPELQVKYDFESTTTPQPPAYTLTQIPLPATFGNATFGDAEFGAAENPLVRQTVEGTGNTVAFRLKSDDQRSPYSINGFYIDYMPAGRK